MSNRVEFIQIVEGAEIPYIAHKGDAGYDLMSAEHFILEPGEIKLASTGIAVDMKPPEMFGMVCSRSGLAVKHGVTVINAPGIVDNDYQGEIKVGLVNLSQNPRTIEIGDRIAQLVFAWSASSEPGLHNAAAQRTDNGFGSTGR